MKRILLVSILLFSIKSSIASHVLGGEIRWECISTGSFVFFATTYVACDDTATYVYSNQSLAVIGNSLPRSSSNSTISAIVLKPDSNKWRSLNNGVISPNCPVGVPSLDCSRGDEGPLRQYFYQSDPIVLKGIPPSSGWTFALQENCCRADVANLAIGGAPMLRAIMFPNKQNTNTQTCFDSSPEFLALPTNLICRGLEYTLNHAAIDKNLDSIVYAWDRAYNGPVSNPMAVPYAAGYTYNNPTPDQNFDSRNNGAILDPISGEISFTIYNGTGFENYSTVVRADAYREGVRVASVFREMPYSVLDCSFLTTGKKNQKPTTIIDGDTTASKLIDIVAGQELRVPIQLLDNDSIRGIPSNQKITIEPIGLLFSTDLSDSANCRTSLLKPCAILRNQSPTFNSVAMPPRWEVNGYLGIATEFVWSPGCQHISTNGTGLPGDNEGIYNFIFKTYDDHCPIPIVNHSTLTIRVRDPLPLTEPIIKGVSVGLDGRLTYSWVPPIDSAKTFHAYDPRIARVPKGQTPTIFQPIRSSLLKRYKSSQRNAIYPIFNTVPGNPNKLNVLDKIQGQDYYLRMNTLSGCNDNEASLPSQPAQIMDLEVIPSGTAPDPFRSLATLNWNAPKPSNANTKPYFVYESTTKYYIWTNEEFNYTTSDGIDVDSNWAKRGSTYNTSYTIPSTKCDGYIAYRIEARDTVITWKQGAIIGLRDSLDTLIFSTFSVIDTMYAVFAPSQIFTENIDYLYTAGIYDSVQWINCDKDSIIPAANSVNFVPQMPGNYSVYVSLENCKDTADCFPIVALDTSVTAVSYLELSSNEPNAKYQWIDCREDTLIPGANSRNFFPEDSGFYAVVLSRYGMKDTSSCFAMLSIGLEEIDWKSQISIYPNPFKNVLNIQSNLNEILELNIYNIHGQLVQETNLEESNSLVKLKEEKGLYFITITNQKGEQANFKVVKQ